jgi:isoleucyl-tRNA synthetase
VARFQSLPKFLNFALEEEEVLDFWDRIDAFGRSIEQRRQKKATPYTFYDGPPFATGLPHYGHLVTSSIKDTVARYWTMRGHYVERRFGWDTHGLPIEMETEKTLGLSGPQSIREFGVEKFNESCRAGVLRYTKEWRRIIGRLGRWVDFDNDYKTMDRSFMESIWWAFSKLWEKGLVYQGFRVMPYSVRLSTPLSNFEANLNYQEVQDPAVTIKIKLIDEENTYLLVWTTTPWTLPANLAVAVGENIDYVKVKRCGDDEAYIVAKDLVKNVFKDNFEIVLEFKGQELLGKRYQPIYPAIDYSRILGDDLKKCFLIISSGHVTTHDGTGLVHMAPSFGVEDFEACGKHGLPQMDPLDEEGRFTKLVPELCGLSFKEADKVILKTLKENKKIFDRSTIMHKYPFCWRSNTPLIYRAVPVWLVDVPKIKERMVLHNEGIHWVPESIGRKRFANWLKDASHWNISRNRFWGTPIPIWQCEHCDRQLCLSSASELESRTGQKVEDLHSHFIDDLAILCEQCSGQMKRIKEVFDCWFESGAMPVAQIHYPFENIEEFKKSFPADFIAEGLDQTRGWFYTLLVLSTALFDRPPFKNAVVNGMVLAADGAKMSKSKKNYPDPEYVINQYGADAVRCYLVGSPVVRGEPLRFDEQGVKEVVRSVMLPLFNCWSFFVQYANIDDFDPKRDLALAPELIDRSEIDRWIISKLQSLIASINTEMTGYYLYKTIPPMLAFIGDLTNWYIRRSRRRFWKNALNKAEQDDKLSAYATLYEVLVCFAKILAPLLPFMSESIYQNLVVGVGMHELDEESIHLCDFPIADEAKIDKPLENHTAIVRQVVAMGRALREKHRLKIRQPLKTLTVVTHDMHTKLALTKHQDLITSELNVKQCLILSEDNTLCKINARPNFKTLGPKLGKAMKDLSEKISSFDRRDICELEEKQEIILSGYKITKDDVIIVREPLNDIVVMSEGHLTVALDTEIDIALQDEGLMRETLSQLQRLRKAKEFLVTARIKLSFFTKSPALMRALKNYKEYLASELLVDEFIINNAPIFNSPDSLEIDGEVLQLEMTLV